MRRAAFLCLAAALSASRPGAARADAFLVTKEADAADGACDADCSLREAVIAANANPGLDYIVLPAGTYSLTIPGTDEDAAATGDLDLTDDVAILGAGREFTSVDAGADERAFDVHGAVEARIGGLAVRSEVTAQWADCGLRNRGGRVVLTDSEWSGCPSGPTVTNLGELEAYDVEFRDGVIGLLNGADYYGFLAQAFSDDPGVDARASLVRCRFTGHGGGEFFLGYGGAGVAGARAGALTISGSEFLWNRFGVFASGTATISECIFQGNEDAGIGGTLKGPSRAEIRDSIIENNGRHGLWFTFSACSYHHLDIGRSIVRGNGFNVSPEYEDILPGGGLAATGELRLWESTVNGNAHFGVYATSTYGRRNCEAPPDVSILNSTISGNGEIGVFAFNTFGAQEMKATTVTNHTLYGINGAEAYHDTPWFVDNSIIDDACAGGRFRGVGNVLRDADCTFREWPTYKPEFNLEGVDPMLGPLQDNGGPTPTHALLPGSPAINIGAAAPCDYEGFETPGVDQRGLPRDAACDAGAYEVQLADLDPLGLLGVAVASLVGPPTVGDAVAALRGIAFAP